MNKKGIMLAVFAVFMLILVSIGIGIIVSNEQKVRREFDIGTNQIALINNYYKAEYDLFNLDQEVRYNSFKAIKEFSDTGGIIKDCNNRWIFNDKCEPDFEKYFIEIFNRKMSEYKIDVKDVRIENNNLIGYVGDFGYNKNLSRMNFTYTVEGRFNESLKINLVALNDKKAQIKKCIQDEEDLEKCAGGKKNGDIYEFSFHVGNMFYGTKFDDVNLNFNIDIKDTGITNSLFNNP